MLKACPHCRTMFDVPEEILWNPSTWVVTTEFGFFKLTERHARIFNLLHRNMGLSGITGERIASTGWDDDADGGPSIWTISSAIRSLRGHLVPLGIQITRDWGGRGYELIKTNPEAAAKALKSPKNGYL